jgi:hypothetical protein
MTLHSLDIPDSPTELGPFLERALVGNSLPDLVGELRAITSGSPAETLDALLSEDRDRVLEQGLGILSFERQRRLLANPRLLLELQELVHTSGGKYWLDRLLDPEAEAAARKSWKRVAAQSVPMAPPRADVSRGRSRRTLMALSLIAAGVFVAGYLAWPKPGEWGWNRPGVFDVALARRAYLEHLAETANEWFSADPQGSSELSTRLREFRSGCDKLLTASHSQLPQDDREWLIERCKIWTAKIDQALVDLDGGQKPPETVSADMKSMVNQLVTALRRRAEESPAVTNRLPWSKANTGSSTPSASA